MKNYPPCKELKTNQTKVIILYIIQKSGKDGDDKDTCTEEFFEKS